MSKAKKSKNNDKIMHLNIQDRNLNDKTRLLRNDGIVPGALYGPDVESTPIKVTNKEFLEALHHEGEIYEVKNKKGSMYVKIDEIQRDPVTRQFLHFSLVQLPQTGESSIEVRVELTGNAKGVKAGGTLLLMKDHLELHGKIQDLPTKLEADISDMEIGGKLTVKDLKIPANCATDLEEDEVIAVLRPPRSEEEDAPNTEETSFETDVTDQLPEQEEVKKSA